MKFIKTYEEFKFRDEESNTQVLEKPTRPKLSDNPIDPTLLGGKESEEKKLPRKSVVSVKNWKVY